MDLQKDFMWVWHHLLLVAVMAALVAGGVWGVQSIIAQHDRANQLLAHEQLAAVQEQVKTLIQTQADHDAAAAQREAQYNATITGLFQEIKARDAALSEQLKKNATLTAKEAADKLTVQYKASGGEIVASGDTIIADLPIARELVNTFDKNLACQADLKDTQGQLTAEQGKNSDLKIQVADRDNTIAGQKEELVKQKKADDEDKKVAVDNEKKKHKWYLFGGMVIVEVIKTYLTGKP